MPEGAPEPAPGTRRVLPVLLVLALAVAAVLVWRALDTEDIDPEAGAGASGGATTLDVAVGDCVVLPGQSGPEGGTEVTGVTVVPCSEPHGAEVFGRATMKDPAYPGNAMVKGFADRACERRFRPYVGTTLDESALGVSWIHPTKASWARGSRNVTCLVYEPEGGQSTGSLRNSKR